MVVGLSSNASVANAAMGAMAERTAGKASLRIFNSNKSEWLAAGLGSGPWLAERSHADGLRPAVKVAAQTRRITLNRK
ncbi:hypothetical protein D9M71_775720 [compost metagenome]